MKFDEVLFWMHGIIFIGWFIPFFIPLSTWPQRIQFHFWYTVVQIVSQFLMGFILMPKMKKFRIVCPLTTWMQKIRGFNSSDKLNFDHSFVREFAKRFNLKLPYGSVAVIIYITFFIVALQFFGVI